MRHYLQSPCNPCADMCHVAWEELRQPKVCYLGAEVSVKENVACFDVTVDNWWPDFFVKVCEIKDEYIQQLS